MIDLIRQHLRLALAVIENPPCDLNHAKCLIYWAIQEAVDILEDCPEHPLAPVAGPRPLSESLEDYPYIRWYLRGAMALADCDHLHGNTNLVTRSLGLALKRLPVGDNAEQAHLRKPCDLH